MPDCRLYTGGNGLRVHQRFCKVKVGVAGQARVLQNKSKVKESFLPVFKDECCDQGCNNHDKRHSDCDYLVNCQTCRKTKI